MEEKTIPVLEALMLGASDCAIDGVKVPEPLCVKVSLRLGLGDGVSDKLIESVLVSELTMLEMDGAVAEAVTESVWLDIPLWLCVNDRESLSLTVTVTLRLGVPV